MNMDNKKSVWGIKLKESFLKLLVEYFWYAKENFLNVIRRIYRDFEQRESVENELCDRYCELFFLLSHSAIADVYFYSQQIGLQKHVISDWVWKLNGNKIDTDAIFSGNYYKIPLTFVILLKNYIATVTGIYFLFHFMTILVSEKTF